MGLADNLKNPKALIIGVIMLVVAIQVLVALLPTLIVSIINISQVSDLSFASFFQSGGVVLLMLSVAILLGILAILGIGKASKR